MSSSHASCVELPAVDERLVAPETRYEIFDGALVYVAPADPPHGTRHSKISALVEAHAAHDFEVASDMLTRTSETSDVAPDVSVFPSAPDPSTGGRQLEQLAFEVVSTQSISHAGHRAAKLASRGVRRVFAVDVERARALEWSTATGSWDVLDPSAYIEDPALAAPLPVAALVHAAKADDAIARALIIKRNPVIEELSAQSAARGKQEGLVEGTLRGKAEGKQEGLVEGKQEGLAEGKRLGLAEGQRDALAGALLDILAARQVALTTADRARIDSERDLDRLRVWVVRAATCANTGELFADP